MTIPLVGQRRLGESSSPYLRQTGFIQNASGSPYSNASIRSLRKETDEAVSNSIQGKATAAEELERDPESPVRIGGYAASALRELIRLSSELDGVEKKTDSVIDGSAQEALLSEREEKIRAEMERIVQSEPFGQALEAARAVESTLQSGPVSRRSLTGAGALLGDEFLNLAAAGASGPISRFTAGLEELSLLGGESLDPEKAASKSRELLSVLASAPRSTTAAPIEEEKTSTITIEAPQYTESNFASAGNIALSLRTFEPKDLLQAVISGYSQSPEELYQLTIKAPEPDDEREEREKEYGRTEELKNSSRDGLTVKETEKGNSEQTAPVETEVETG